MTNRTTARLIVNLHRERILATRTLKFVAKARLHAKENSLDLFPIVVLDRPDDFTLETARSLCSEHDFEMHVVDFGDLATSREFGISKVESGIVFLLDGDDMTSLDWFPKAAEHLSNRKNRKHICHTEYFVSFDRAENVRFGIDTRDPGFQHSELALDWFFCNNLACLVDVFRDVPFRPYDHANGIGGEDWLWSADTIAAGYDHVVIPDTSYFYRIKPTELSLGSSAWYMPWSNDIWAVDEGDVPSFVSRLRKKVRELAFRRSDVLPRATINSCLATPDFTDQVLKKIEQSAESLYEIDPTLSWLSAPSEKTQFIVPGIDEKMHALFRKMSGDDIQEIIVIASDQWTFSPALRRFVANRSAKTGTVVLDLAAHSNDDGFSREWIDFASLDWRGIAHFERVIMRLLIDKQPRLVLQNTEELFAMTERYSRAMHHFAKSIEIVGYGRRVDVFDKFRPAVWRRMLGDAEFPDSPYPIEDNSDAKNFSTYVSYLHSSTFRRCVEFTEEQLKNVQNELPQDAVLFCSEAEARWSNSFDQLLLNAQNEHTLEQGDLLVPRRVISVDANLGRPVIEHFGEGGDEIEARLVKGFLVPLERLTALLDEPQLDVSELDFDVLKSLITRDNGRFIVAEDRAMVAIGETPN